MITKKSRGTNVDYFYLAYLKVERALGTERVSYEWPGTIDIILGDLPAAEGSKMLIFGTVNETINADAVVLVGNMWDEAPFLGPVTDVPSDSKDSQRIVNAILDAYASFKMPSAATEL